MTFFEKVEKLCAPLGLTVWSLAEQIGLSTSAPTGWKKSDFKPRAATLKKLSDYFNVPIEYFTDENFVLEQKERTPDSLQSERSNEFVQLFEKLTDEEKLNVVSLMKLLSSQRG